MMNDKIIGAFNEVHADSQLKENTKKLTAQKLSRRSVKAVHPKMFKLAYAFAMCFIFFIAFGGYNIYFTPTSIISIDINPSIEIGINRLNKVISVEGYNEDGVDFANSLDILYDDYEDAIDEVLQSDTIKTCLAKDEFLSVAVVEINGTQSEDILQYVSNCTSGHKNAYCYGLSSDDASSAHSLGLSYGKYNIYQELHSCGSHITPEEASEMTMKELRQMLYDLDPESENASSQNYSCDNYSSEHGHGNGHGSGNGNGYGKHYGQN